MTLMVCAFVGFEDFRRVSLFFSFLSKSEEIRMFKNFRFVVYLLDGRVVHDHFAQHLRGDGVLRRLVEVS